MSAQNKALTLSIVIPAYNEEGHLAACLDAIAAQTVMPDEVIVVDNNSTDKTAVLAKNYPFVRIIKEPRQGVVFARDAGFDAVNSVLIGRIDADTILQREWTERVLDYYKTAESLEQAMSGGAYFYNVRFGHLAGWWQGQIAFRMNRLLLGHNILYGSNAVVPRSLWKHTRTHVCDDTDVHEDLDLAIHLYRLGYQIDYHDNLKVGVKMRRVFSDRSELWQNLMWWPRTLRRHGLATWVIGWMGAAVLYIASWTWFAFKK